MLLGVQGTASHGKTNQKHHANTSQDMKREREREQRVALFPFACLCVQSEILENFAFCKAEVLFWQKTDAETLKRYVSLRAIFGEIFCILVALGKRTLSDPAFHMFPLPLLKDLNRSCDSDCVVQRF